MEFIHRHLLLIVQNDFIETAVHLRDGSVELAQRVLLGIKQLLGTGHEKFRHDHCQWYDHQRHAGQNPVDIKHHGNNKYKCQHCPDDTLHRLLKGIAQRVHVIGHNTQHITEGVIIKIADRQSMNLLLKRISDIIHGLLQYFCQENSRDQLGYCLDDINDELGLELVSENSETLGGFIIELLGDLPDEEEKEDKVIEYENLVFKIESVKDRRIEKVKLYITPESSNGSEE